jgi:signal transduction histidine kinase
MLHEFLTANRDEVIASCQARVAQRSAPQQSDTELDHGVPLFLDMIIKALREKEASLEGDIGPSSNEGEAGSEMGVVASRHGRELMRRGFTVEQVVRDYGDLCQVITGLAIERGARIRVEDFQTLNRCLDDGIADAVTEFAYERDLLMADRAAETLNERLGFLAHELRNFLQSASIAIGAIKRGNVGLTGSTGAILERSLVGMSNLIDRSLAEVRIEAGLPDRYERISVADFIADVKISASLEAEMYGCALIVPVIDPSLALDADRGMLFSAVGNLLQNAFKFSGRGSEIKLNAYAESDRVVISVEDRCGGLPPGAEEKMFLPFTQSGIDKSGLGLGLAICRRCTEMNNGALRVRDLPGIGCVFTIDLPRHAMA